MLDFRQLYDQMFEAKQSGDVGLADSLMERIEALRKSQSTDLSDKQVESLLPKLPRFARDVFGKTQLEVCPEHRSNCINAAFNFHDEQQKFETYSTMEFLDKIQKEYRQIDGVSEGLSFGDLIVMWSRTGGSWDEKRIVVGDIDKSDADFPYGLVFDHVAVFLGQDIVFHKPDPTLESAYRFDHIESAISVTQQNKGFELTYHRRTGEN